MALTAAQITQAFEIFGVPQTGSGDVAAQLSTPFGAVFDTHNFSAVAEKITARLAALSDTQIARAVSLLQRWDALTSSSPLRITQAGSGVVADHDAERALIRTVLSNIVGVATPSGGFAAEASRSNGALSLSR